MTATVRPIITLTVSVLLAAALGLGGCAEALYGPGPAADQSGGSGSADLRRRSLWERITMEHYSKWKVAPGYQVPQSSEGPHGDRIQIFLNDAAATAREQAQPEWPDGSIIVADFLDEHAIVRVAAMEKRSGAWYFSLWMPDGKTLPPDNEGDCVSCHKAGTDGTLGVRTGP